MAVLSLSYHSVLTLYLINNSIYTDGLVILLYTILKKKKPALTVHSMSTLFICWYLVLIYILLFRGKLPRSQSPTKRVQMLTLCDFHV